MDWRSSYRGDNAHRRHRKRRFYVHPAARGLGRYACQTARAASPAPAEEIVTEVETGAGTEKQRAHATARKGLFLIAWIGLLLIVCVRFGWFFRAYTWVVDTWMTLMTGSKIS